MVDNATYANSNFMHKNWGQEFATRTPTTPTSALLRKDKQNNQKDKNRLKNNNNKLCATL